MKKLIEQAKRVLIYRLGSLGDTVVALPCLHLIAQAFPKAERFILTVAPANNKAPAISSVLGGSGLVNGYINYSFRAPGLKCLYELRKKIIDWHPDTLIYLPGQRGLIRIIRDMLFFKSCGIKEIIGVPFARDLRINRLLSDKLHFEHETVRLARCIDALGDARLESLNSWDLLLSASEYQAAGNILEGWEGRNNFIACSIGTKFEVNDWGIKNWQELLRQLSRKYSGYGLVFFGSSDEFSRSEQLSKSWLGPSLNLCGKLEPRVAAAVLKGARIFLGHDSGPMHLAAAVGIPCVAVFSARNKPGVWFPYGASHRAIYHKQKCFGCGLAVCKKYNKKCINSITAEEVYDAVCQVKR